jgi:hypothetical protein
MTGDGMLSAVILSRGRPQLADGRRIDDTSFIANGNVAPVLRYASLRAATQDDKGRPFIANGNVAPVLRYATLRAAIQDDKVA